MAQEQISHKGSGKSDNDQETAVIGKKADSSELATEVDDLLADIDAVLEENAEEFVASFVQKGGE